MVEGLLQRRGGNQLRLGQARVLQQAAHLQRQLALDADHECREVAVQIRPWRSPKAGTEQSW